jgi:hypothetical protein
MIESGVKNVRRRNAMPKQLFDRLQQQRRLPYLPRSTHQQGAICRWIGNPTHNLAEGRPPPTWKIRKTPSSPPRIVLTEDRKKLGLRRNHQAKQPKITI